MGDLLPLTELAKEFSKIMNKTIQASDFQDFEEPQKHRPVLRNTNLYGSSFVGENGLVNVVFEIPNYGGGIGMTAQSEYEGDVADMVVKTLNHLLKLAKDPTTNNKYANTTSPGFIGFYDYKNK
ncbi:MAG: hypothetical protein ABH828_01485 [archaeon]